jgi:hypothetical protein
MRNQAAVKILLEDGFQRFTTFSVQEQVALASWAAFVVEQYHQVLNSHQVRVKDIGLLPYPKQEVKLAIKVSMLPYITKDEQEGLQGLKYDYISLAMFQTIRAEDRQTIAQAAQNDKARSEDSAYPLFQEYLNLALAEQNSLLDEIDSFIADIEAILN